MLGGGGGGGGEGGREAKPNVNVDYIYNDTSCRNSYLFPIQFSGQEMV